MPAKESQRLGRILVEMGVLRMGQLQAALAEQRRSGGRLGAVLVERGDASPGDLAQAMATQKGLEWLNPDDLEATPAALAALDSGTARAFGVLPLGESSGKLRVATSDPDILPLLGDLEAMAGMPIEVVLSDPVALEAAVETAYGGREKAAAESVAHDAELGDTAPIVRLLESILHRAVRLGAADVHFEPYLGEFRIRMRVDGVLFEIDPPPAHLAAAVVSRIKVMANLDISETRMPQDGRIELQVDGRRVDLRVSTVPTQGGESVVLRILDRRNLRLDLNELGLSGDEKKSVEDLASRPHGIVLVTGPTGSGKTTTLYSVLQGLNTEDCKILTVEDPVEYDLDGIVQVPVNDSIGVTYAGVLRTMLRQDPDVILVGEIRDPETAQIAVEAALTGHLVLSTLHTNDAPSTITRMVDLGVEPFLLAATLEGVIAQRLVRKICPDCVESVPEDSDLCARAGLEVQDMSRGRGCERCRFTGYFGRVALFETMAVDDAVRVQFLSDPSTLALRKLAQKRNMVTLRERGIQLALAGGTTLEEILRETQDAED